MAIQNIEDVAGVFKECQRVLKSGGKLFLVMNHPAFRIPKQSDWGWDPSAGSGRAGGIQYRRIDEYLSESKVKIQMHPSAVRRGSLQASSLFRGASDGQAGRVPANKAEITISFHRPLQYYFKLLSKNGFAVSRLEEWNSNRKSQPGPRSKAEDKARKEIPLFMFMESIKLN